MRLRDFGIEVFQELLDSFGGTGFLFQPFAEYLERPGGRAIILRHDVDKRPGHSVRLARIEADRGIRGTYYFRCRRGRWEEEAIRAVHALGHEVGYHYETMDQVPSLFGEGGRRPGGITHHSPLTTHHSPLTDQAYELFCRNLETLRRIVPVTTICMHGSPRAKHDNREIWKQFDYRALGIAGEPYFDLDTAVTAYLTDTGRMWDGGRYSVRDRMNNGTIEQENNRTLEQENRVRVHSTFDLIEAVRNGSFPDRAMLTFHPQRWTDNLFEWVAELGLQRAKNMVKGWLFVTRDEVTG